MTTNAQLLSASGSALQASTVLKHLHFFDLPRELRDMIYTELAPNYHHDYGTLEPFQKPHPIFQVLPQPKANYRLVSRQFKSEYDEELSKPSTLMINPTAGDLSNFLMPVGASKCGLGSLLSTVKKVVLQIEPEWCQKWWPANATVPRLQTMAGVVEPTSKLAHELSSCMTAGCVLSIELLMKADKIDQYAQRGLWTPEKFFNMRLSNREDVRLETRLFMKSRLFDIYMKIVQDSETARHALNMSRASENYVVFEARPTGEGHYGWQGLELSLYSAGEYDEDKILARAKDQVKWSSDEAAWSLEEDTEYECSEADLDGEDGSEGFVANEEEGSDSDLEMGGDS